MSEWEEALVSVINPPTMKQAKGLRMGIRCKRREFLRTLRF